MLARYHGHCCVCKQRITAGCDVIGKSEDRWVHTACIDKKTTASVQAGPHSIKQRLFLDLPYPFRLVLEHLKVGSNPLDTFSSTALHAFNALNPSRGSWEALQQQLDADATAARSTKTTMTAPRLKAVELIQLMVEQRWVVWDGVLMKFRENPEPPQLPPYHQRVTARLHDEGFGPTVDICFGNTDALTGSYLIRHPKVAAHHRLLFINVDSGHKAANQIVPSLIRQGLSLGGRHFSALFFKHSRDKGTLTLTFFATHEDVAGDACRPGSPAPPQMPPMSVEQAVAQLGAVGHLWQTPARLVERMTLLTSSTEPLYIKASMIVYVDDIRNRVAGMQGDLMTDGAGLMSLDVAQQIPRSLGGRKLEAAPGANLTDATSVVQVRLFDPRGFQPIVAKGLLTPCSALPPNTVVVTRSMVKAPPSPVLDEWLTQIPAASIPWSDRPLYTVKGLVDQTQDASLEVANAVFDALPGRMNSNIVTLLGHTCAVEPLFTRIINDAVAKIEEAATDYDASLQCAKSNRFFALQYLLEAKVGCVEDPDPDSNNWVFRPDAYLLSELQRMQQLVLEELQAMRFFLPEAGRLVGLPDCSQSIPQGCCVAVREGMPWLPAIPAWKPFNALLYRDPGLDPCTDIQPARIIEPPKGFHAMYGGSSSRNFCVKNALFFSTQGTASLASQLASGDFDGDLYVIITNPEVVQSYKGNAVQQPQERSPQRPEAPSYSPCTKAAAQAAARIPLPDETEPEDGGNDNCSREEQQQQQQQQQQEQQRQQQVCRFLNPGEIAGAYHLCSRVSSQISNSCILWKAWADLEGPASAQARELAHIYMASLDALKTGNLPNIPQELVQGYKHKPIWDVDEGQQQLARQALLEGGGAMFSMLARLYLFAKGSPLSSPQTHEVIRDEDLALFPGSDDPDVEVLCKKVHGLWRSEWAKFKEEDSSQEEKSIFSEKLRRICAQTLFGAASSFSDASCTVLRRLQVASAFYRLVYSFEAATRRVPPRLSAPWQICGTELKHIKVMTVTYKVSKGQQLLPERVVAQSVPVVRDSAGVTQ